MPVPVSGASLEVVFPEQLLRSVPEEKRGALLGVLAQDPRPAYQHDPGRIYGMLFGGYNIRFSVDGGVLTVHSVNLTSSSQSLHVSDDRI